MQGTVNPSTSVYAGSSPAAPKSFFLPDYFGASLQMKNFDINSSKLKERILIQNSLAFSFLSYMPIVPGHSLICPIRAVESSEELTFEEWKAILALQAQVCQALTKVFSAEGFNFAWNGGEVAGQTVPHFHLHIVPRKPGDEGVYEYEPRSFLYRPGSRAVSPSDELQQTAQLIREQI